VHQVSADEKAAVVIENSVVVHYEIKQLFPRGKKTIQLGRATRRARIPFQQRL